MVTIIDPKKILLWYIQNGDNRGTMLARDLGIVIEQIEELEKDKRRLDWLADKDNTAAQVLLPRECVENNLTSMRDAIDHAMTLTE